MQFIKLRLLHAIMKACVRNTDALNSLMDDEETWNGMSSLLGLCQSFDEVNDKWCPEAVL